MRCGYSPPAGAERSGKKPAHQGGAGRGQAGPAGDGAGQSAAGVKRCTAVCGPRREHGRPVSGRVYRAHQGHRQL